MWNPDSIMENLYQSYENKRLHQKRDDVEQTKIRLKRHLVKSLDIALEEQDELRPVLLERTELEDHFRERIEFGTVWGFRVPAFVLLPKGMTERRAAVLALHGHGYGSRQIVGLHPDGTENTGKPDLHGNYALELVKRGS